MKNFILLTAALLACVNSLRAAPNGIGSEKPEPAEYLGDAPVNEDRQVRALEFYIAALMEHDPGKRISLLLDSVKLDPQKRLPLLILVKTVAKVPAAVPAVKKTMDQLRRTYPLDVFLALQSVGIAQQAGDSPESIVKSIRPVLLQKKDKKYAKDFNALAQIYVRLLLKTTAAPEILPFAADDVILKEAALYYYTTISRRDALLMRKSPAEKMRKKYLAELAGAEFGNDAELRRHLALLNSVKEFDAAFAAAGKALKKKKNLMTTLFFLEAAARSGKMEILKQELKKFPSLPVSLCSQLRFQCYQAQGNFAGARDELDNFSEKNGKTEKLLQICRQMNDLSGMKKILQQLERTPQKNRSVLTLGYLNLAEAAADGSALDKAKELLGGEYLQNPSLANAVGYVSAVAGKDLQTAEMLLEFALAKEPRNAAYLDSMAWIKYKRRDYRQALEFIRKAMIFWDNSAGISVISEHAGDIYLALGDKAAAQKYYKMALEDYKKDIIGNTDFNPDALRKKLTDK